MVNMVSLMPILPQQKKGGVAQECRGTRITCTRTGILPGSSLQSPKMFEKSWWAGCNWDKYEQHLCFFNLLAIPKGSQRPRGIGRRGRWEGGLGWGTHVNPWLIHVNVWQKPLQYCKVIQFSSVQRLSPVAQSCPTLWDPMSRSTPGLPVHHKLPEFTKVISLQLIKINGNKTKQKTKGEPRLRTTPSLSCFQSIANRDALGRSYHWLSPYSIPSSLDCLPSSLRSKANLHPESPSPRQSPFIPVPGALLMGPPFTLKDVPR